MEHDTRKPRYRYFVVTVCKHCYTWLYTACTVVYDDVYPMLKLGGEGGLFNVFISCICYVSIGK